MKTSIPSLALAAALAVSAGTVLAQQQSYGRDSVYADPTQAARTPVATADPAIPARFGRDSVYATVSSTPTTQMSADATRLQRFGRGSVYAIQLDGPAGDIGETRIGRAAMDRSAN
jgi:hypothetical protein